MTRKKQPPSGMPAEPKRDKKLVKEESAWRARLKRSKAFQARYMKTWEENRRLIFGEIGAETGPGSSTPWTQTTGNSVAYGWGLYKGLETSIYVQNPDVIVSGWDAASMPVARRITAICKYDLEQMNAKDVGNLAFLDAFLCGYGGVIETVETSHKRDENGEKTDEVESQEFCLRRVDPKDILFDPNFRRLDLSDCNYLFVAWYPTVEDLQNDEDITDLPDNIEEFPEANEYTRTIAKSEGSAERQAATLVGSPGGGKGEQDPAFRTVCVWEVYDKKNREILLMTDYKQQIIGRREWPVVLKFGARELFPVTLLYQHPLPGRAYPRAEVDMISPQLKEMNVVERLISEDTRTKFRKYLTVANILTEDQKSKVTDTTIKNALLFVDLSKLQDVLGIQGSPIDLSAIDLTKLVVPMEDIAPKKDLFGRFDMLEKEIQHIVGYGPSARGGLPSTRSAREAMMINQEKERRLDKRKDHIGDFYRLLSSKHVRFLQKFMATDRYAKVLPKSGQLAEWIQYGRDDISGTFEFDVLAGTSAPKSTEVKKASELQLFQAVAPILQQSGLPLRPAFERLAEYYDWQGVDNLFANVKEKAAMALQAMVGFSKGQVPPEALLNVFSQLLMAEFSPQEFQMLKGQMEKGTQGQPGGGQPPASPPAGQRGDARPLATQGGVP